MDRTVDLMEVTLALSDALDLVGVKVVQHGKRVAFMANEMAVCRGLDDPLRAELFRAALLHDCGVSSTELHRKLHQELDWEGSDDHCRRGAALLAGFSPFSRLRRVVRFHHTEWNDPKRSTIPRRISLLADMVHLADRVDAMIGRSSGDVLLARDGIRREVEAHAGTWFSPASVGAFLDVSRAEAFWLGLESHHLDRAIGELATSFPDARTIGVEDLRALAQIFARIVDDKSPFTAEHSQGVARVAGLLGKLLGRPAAECALLEIAGLLHDVGKLRVPDAVLDKPAPLDPEEFASIQRHTFETWQILRRVHALRPIAAWAAMHHERPTEGGYPFHLAAGQMPLQARIVAVADVLQAFAQDRPYRRALSKERAFSTLAAMAAQGRLDTLVVARAEADQDACWAAATGLH